MNQDPECPPLVIEKWLKIIVCNRCGKYLEAYRRIDDSIAFIAGHVMLACKSASLDKVKSDASQKIVALTQELNRILTKRWNTTGQWSFEIVELMLEKPDMTRRICRMEEANHRKAREHADREATQQGAMKL
jgi:hypothetical protein